MKNKSGSRVVIRKGNTTRHPLCPDCMTKNTVNTVGDIYKCNAAECGTIWDTKNIPTVWASEPT